MRSKFSLLLYVATAVAAHTGFHTDRCAGFDGCDVFEVDGCCPADQHNYFNPGTEPNLVFSGAAVAMRRSHLDSQPLVTSGVVAAEVFNIDQLDLDFEAGYEFTARLQNDGKFVEFRFLTIDDAFDDRRVINVPGGGGAILTNPATAFAAAQLTATYSSDFDSGEVNLGISSSEDVEWFAGYRMIEIDENFILRETGGVFELGSHTNNHIHIFQLGARRNFQLGDRFSLAATGKFGAGWNDAESRVTSAQPPGAFLGTARDDEEKATFSLEGALTARYAIRNHWSFIAGYQVLYLKHVAVAPAQFANSTALTTATSIDFDSTLYHGGLFGVEACY